MNSVNESRQEVQAVRRSADETGAPTKVSGIGLMLVKERIQAEFERARQNHVVKRVRPMSKPPRSLTQVAAPALRVVQHRLSSTTVWHALHQDAHFVAVPRESANELFALCERAVSKLNIPRDKSGRFDVEDGL
jgi:hypothetical protein